MTKKQLSEIKSFAGFDSAAEVFLIQDRVYRGIYPGNGATYRRVLHTLENHDLFRLGIVPTQIIKANPCSWLPYELVLEHEKIPFITYPHEWPATMLQAAALFHSDLYYELGLHGLTLKDWHPYNILFKRTDPILIDFASIIPTADLPLEKYLTPAHPPMPFRSVWDVTSKFIWEMHQRMFAPYFLLPLYLMHQGRHDLSRRRLLETTLNASFSCMRESELLSGRDPTWITYRINTLRKMIALTEKGRVKKRFWREVSREVDRLNVAVKHSNYSSYYEAKKESLPFEPSTRWTAKQKVVYEAILGFKPATVLDLAANTGWFSILAAKLGCDVVALDLDEACIDSLYAQARTGSLPILPLVADINNMSQEKSATAPRDEHSLIDDQLPLLLAAEKRLKCDMVLALAIVHHLALGQNQGFEKIVKLLNVLSKNYLIVEFVPRDDELVASEPDFFPAIKRSPSSFEWYTEENLVLELRRFFSKIKVLDSYPRPRTLILCEKH